MKWIKRLLKAYEGLLPQNQYQKRSAGKVYRAPSQSADVARWKRQA